MMNRFKRHIPAFVDVDRPDWIPFETTADLLNLEIVKRYRTDTNFSHFAMEDNALMVISDNGFHWWVVGFIEKPDEIDLPKWEGWKFKAELANGERVILGNEVVSSCDGVLTLRDGTTARKLRDNK